MQKSKTVKDSLVRLRTSTISTTTGDESVIVTRGRGIIPMRLVRPSSVKSYPLIHSTVGSPSLVTPSLTKFGGGVEFDGSSYFIIDDHSLLKPTDEMSLSMWLYLPATEGGDGIKDLINKNNQFGLKVRAHATTPNSLQMDWGVGASFTTMLYTYTPNTWFHLVTTAKNGSQKMFIDTVQEDSKTLSGSLKTDTYDLHIGAGHLGTNKAKSGTRMSWFSLLNKDVDGVSGWVTNHHDGILDTAAATEITTIPFTGSFEPKPDATSGMCMSS